MRQIRFVGLVRLANHVQRELSRPVSAARCEQLRSDVRRAVAHVSSTLRFHGASLRAVPGPTRRAFEFLCNFDFASVATIDDAAGPPRESLSLRGITATVEQICERLGRGLAESPLSIRELVSRIETANAGAGCRPEHFTARTREHLAWLKFMAEAGNFAAYGDALRRATVAMEAVALHDRWPRPIVVHLRPTHSIFRARVSEGHTRCLLPTPMIALDLDEFAKLARAIFGRRRPSLRAALHQLQLSAAYQELQAELAALAGVIEDTRGLAHDLAESFIRVNTDYFAGAMPRPQLTWNRSITAGKFGHYNFASDTIMLSRALDRPGVPSFVVDHVMHHELLHKKHGIRWHAGRGHAHTPEFRDEERRFAKFNEADEFLRRLATCSTRNCYNPAGGSMSEPTDNFERRQSCPRP